ncbi:GNAT family N-acetyltransferase [Radiobacillus kanasensis]|uniref:GNAT family N-acetyltransferase n=1 Tax=Radiobacillus kanasensis TaxID=2844358 RepID=UPI001E52AB6A|nr:GNAT family N-acetyltransferase [Radiobacillus kanasensis]UFT99778.1 GNAT family N-acetyltransferase [Radiobacillus kanasensis]
MEWMYKHFEQLTTTELYQIIKARIDVFVLEQECAYSELDNHDQASTHLFLHNGEEVIAYARLLPKGTTYSQASFGRVLVNQNYRGGGHAKELLQRSIDYILKEWDEEEIKIQGQEYLRHFYSSFGFEEISDVYLEDGIPHVDMILNQKR